MVFSGVVLRALVNQFSDSADYLLGLPFTTMAANNFLMEGTEHVVRRETVLIECQMLIVMILSQWNLIFNLSEKYSMARRHNRSHA